MYINRNIEHWFIVIIIVIVLTITIIVIIAIIIVIKRLTHTYI